MENSYHKWDNYPECKNPNDGTPHSRPLRLYLLAKREYYKGLPIMSDQVFDAFELDIKKKFPDCPALQVVGEPSDEDIKNLTEWMYEKRQSIHK